MNVVTAVTVLGPYLLDVTFADGARGTIDVSSVLWGEVFEPLQDLAYFARASVDAELGTVVWPNGADIAPEFLREHLAATTR